MKTPAVLFVQPSTALPFGMAGWLMFLFLASTAFSQSENRSWNQWRGPNRDGHVPSSFSWPDSLDEKSLVEKWSKSDLGPSYSGPIVSGDHLFVTETVDKKSEVVTAFDRTSGKKRWQNDWSGAMKVPFFARENGDWIRSTPATDGKHVVVAGMRDVLVCLNADTGKVKWSVDFVQKYKTPLPSFGFVCSPLIDGDSIYVQAAASFLKVKVDSGEVVWRTLVDKGGMNGSAFSSPLIASVNGKRIAIVQTRTTLAGVQLSDGKVLWQQEIPAFRGMNILTPTVYDNGIFTSAYGGTSGMFSIEAANNDRATVKQKWKNGKQGYMCSPVVVDGYAYLHLRNRRFTCINLRNGKTQWTTQPFGKYWSLVTDGKKILALDEKGMLRLIAADPKEYRELDKREVGNNCWAHLAIDKDWIYIRGLRSITAYQWK